MGKEGVSVGREKLTPTEFLEKFCGYTPKTENTSGMIVPKGSFDYLNDKGENKGTRLKAQRLSRDNQSELVQQQA